MHWRPIREPDAISPGPNDASNIDYKPKSAAVSV